MHKFLRRVTFPSKFRTNNSPESQPEGLGFSQSSEGLQNPLTTDLESRQSELSEYVSGNNQRPELAERQRPQDRGQEMHTASDGTVTDDPAGEDPEAITPPTSLSGINPGLDLLSHSQEQQGNAIQHGRHLTWIDSAWHSCRRRTATPRQA